MQYLLKLLFLYKTGCFINLVTTVVVSQEFYRKTIVLSYPLNEDKVSVLTKKSCNYNMRPLTEEETKTLFEKLSKYIGDNIKLLIDRSDGAYCFRLHRDRVYYVSEKIMKQVGNLYVIQKYQYNLPLRYYSYTIMSSHPKSIRRLVMLHERI